MLNSIPCMQIGGTPGRDERLIPSSVQQARTRLWLCTVGGFDPARRDGPAISIRQAAKDAGTANDGRRSAMESRTNTHRLRIQCRGTPACTHARSEPCSHQCASAHVVQDGQGKHGSQAHRRAQRIMHSCNVCAVAWIAACLLIQCSHLMYVQSIDEAQLVHSRPHSSGLTSLCR